MILHLFLPQYVYIVEILEDYKYEIINFLLSGKMRDGNLSQERYQFLQARLILTG